MRAAVFAVLASLLLACGPGQAGPVATSSGGTAGAGGEPGSTGPGGAGGAGGSGGAGGAPPTAEASILTWNLEFFPHGAGAVEQAAAIVLDLDPDLIAVQEIAEPAAFDDLLSALPEYDGILNDDPGAYLRVGLVYRRDRVSLSEVETLFSDDGYAFPRPPLKARVSLDGSIDFVALVVHLKAQLDTESEARRRAACYALDEWVRAERANGEEQDYLLLGDFNDKLTDPPSWNVFGAFLDRPEVYSFLTMPLAQAGEHSYIPFESMIDHVLVTNDLLDEVGAGTTEVLPLEQSVPDYLDLTDHRPVRTWLEP